MGTRPGTVVWIDPAVQATGRCPVCRTSLACRPVRCARCGALHHPDCWVYVGSCSVFGCRRQSVRSPGRDLGDMLRRLDRAAPAAPEETMVLRRRR